MKQKQSPLRRAVGCVAKWYLLRLALPCAYRFAARRPLREDKAVFVVIRKKALSDSLRLLYDACAARSMTVSLHCLNYSEARFPTLLRECRALMRDIADAKAVFQDDSCDAMGCFRRRKGQQVVQIWHACGAFKKFGWSAASMSFGETPEEMTRYPSHRNYTLVPVSGPQVAENYEEAFSAPHGIVRALGVSRTDVFFAPDFIPRSRALVEEAVPAAKGKRILLYAPTFRGHVADAAAPECFDLRALKAQCGADSILLVRQHYLVHENFHVPEDCRDFVFDVGQELPIDNLLAAADVCITDYSSLVFEYSLFGRPMIFYAPDLCDYNDWRGFYYDYRTFVPGPIVEDTAGLLRGLQEIKHGFDKSRMEDFRIRFMAACDGHATERILKKVFGN